MRAKTEARITVVREQGKHLPCNILDASATLCCVATQEPLLPGETVRLWSRDGRRIMEVRGCALDEGHYSIDLECVDDRLGPLRSIALRELFDRVPGDPAPPPRKMTEAAVGFAAASLLVTAGILLSVSGLIDRASAGQPRFVQTPVPDSVPVVAKTPDASHLSIRATALSWVTACADGRKLFERLLQPGESSVIPFSETAIVRSGNAGGVEVSLGDWPLGAMGRPGVIRMLLATPQGYEYVAPLLSDACLAN